MIKGQPKNDQLLIFWLKNKYEQNQVERPVMGEGGLYILPPLLLRYILWPNNSKYSWFSLTSLKFQSLQARTNLKIAVTSKNIMLTH